MSCQSKSKRNETKHCRLCLERTKRLTPLHQSRGRYDPALAGICFQMLLELFGRTLSSDLGPMAGEVPEPEDVC
jgi:hypothetical protein